jgi:hypothetical protein
MNMSSPIAQTRKPIAKGTIAFVLATIALLVLSAYFYTQITVLQTQIECRRIEYQQLQSEYDTLEEKYEEDQAHIGYLTEALEEKYEEDLAYIRCLTIPMPRGLDEHYFLLRKYELARARATGWLLFYVTAVLHDLGNYSYDHCIEFRKYGEDCRPKTATFAERFLDYLNKSHPNVSNISRVQQVYDWVNTFVSYRNLITRFPIETLIFRCGDCDDQAMALSFLLEACGYETAVCGIGDENLTLYGPGGFFHVFMAVRKKNFEYDGTLVQLNGYPEYGNNWILLDPTFDHQFGEDPEWIEFYRMENGTFHIPHAVWDCLLVDYDELVKRAEEMGGAALAYVR